MTALLEILSDYTLQNVAIGAALLGVSSGVLGSFAVLRRQSLLGDTLSHAALPGVCLGFLLAGSRQLVPILAGALVSGAAAALLMLLLTKRSRLKTDAGLGIALSTFFAFGVVLLTYIQGRNNASQAGLDSFLFGQAAAMLRGDLWLIGGIAAIALALVALLWKEFKVVAFDPSFAASLGLPVAVIELVLTVMIALAVVIGLQMVGVVLMAAMIIAPAAAARQWSKRLESMVLLAALFGALSSVAGALISAFGRGLATGPVIIVCASLIVLVSLLFAPERGLLWAALEARQSRNALRTQRVLTGLYQLSQHHDDPAYQAEQGMLDTYYRVNTRHALRKLSRRGFVKAVTHMPEEGHHWQLTPEGQREAERLLRQLGPKEP